MRTFALSFPLSGFDGSKTYSLFFLFCKIKYNLKENLTANKIKLKIRIGTYHSVGITLKSINPKAIAINPIEA